MSDLVAGTMIVVLFAMLIVYIMYFVFLYRYMRIVQKHDAELWRSYRSSAKLFETPLFTAFRILRRKRPSVDSTPKEMIAVEKATTVLLYSGMALFLAAMAMLLIFDSMVA